MDQSTKPVAFLFSFYACKLLKMLYLFASLGSVYLKETLHRDIKNRTHGSRFRNFNLVCRNVFAYISTPHIRSGDAAQQQSRLTVIARF